jgi:hypothetical protein
VLRMMGRDAARRGIAASWSRSVVTPAPREAGGCVDVRTAHPRPSNPVCWTGLRRRCSGCRGWREGENWRFSPSLRMNAWHLHYSTCTYSTPTPLGALPS